MRLLSVEHLQSERVGVSVLRDVSLRVDRGEVVTIRGANGSGKSTLLATIAGLLPSKGGRINLRGYDITYLSPHERSRKGLFFLTQGVELAELIRVVDNLRLCQRRAADLSILRGLVGRRSAEEALLLGLAKAGASVLGQDASLNRAGKLSGGQRKQLGLLMAGYAEANVLLLDEPFAGLSADVRDWALETIRALAAKGRGVVVVEHLQVSEAISHCSYTLRDGHLVESESRAEPKP